jgi:hypothetical protein
MQIISQQFEAYCQGNAVSIVYKKKPQCFNAVGLYLVETQPVACDSQPAVRPIKSLKSAQKLTYMYPYFLKHFPGYTPPHYGKGREKWGREGWSLDPATVATSANPPPPEYRSKQRLLPDSYDAAANSKQLFLLLAISLKKSIHKMKLFLFPECLLDYSLPHAQIQLSTVR